MLIGPFDLIVFLSWGSQPKKRCHASLLFALDATRHKTLKQLFRIILDISNLVMHFDELYNNQEVVQEFPLQIH